MGIFLPFNPLFSNNILEEADGFAPMVAKYSKN